MSAPIIIVDSDDEESNRDEPTSTLLGTTEYPIVGIRYYTGVAHPGEFVMLVREVRDGERWPCI